MEQKPDQKKIRDAAVYISNPFKLAFEAAGRMFESNKVWAIVLVILGLVGGIPRTNGNTSTGSESATSLTSNSDTTTIVATVIFIAGIVIVVGLLVGILATYFQGMLSYVALQSEKGIKVSFKEASKAVSERFWRLLGAQLLALVKIFGWTLLFIVPGIIASLRYALLSYVIMDEPKENKSIKDSHDRVKSLTKSRLIEVLGVSFTGIVPIIGGVFDLAGKASQYLQLKHFNDNNLEKPKIHWLNILGAILLAVILALVVLIISAFAVADGFMINI